MSSEMMAMSGNIAETAITVAGHITEGIAAERQSKAQARFLKQKADYGLRAAAVEAEDYWRSGSRVSATQRSRLGGSGVDVERGTARGVREDTYREIALMKERLLHKGKVQAIGLEQQADYQKILGKHRKRMAFFSAGAAAFGGASKFAEQAEEYKLWGTDTVPKQKLHGPSPGRSSRTWSQ